MNGKNVLFRGKSDEGTPPKFRIDFMKFNFFWVLLWMWVVVSVGIFINYFVGFFIESNFLSDFVSSGLSAGVGIFFGNVLRKYLTKIH